MHDNVYYAFYKDIEILLDCISLYPYKYRGYRIILNI